MAIRIKMAKDFAIDSFRVMWLWIARETEKRKRKVQKHEYFTENLTKRVFSSCYLCEYVKQQRREKEASQSPSLFLLNRQGLSQFDCKTYCPILFSDGSLGCCDRKSLYWQWQMCPDENWEKASKLAFEISKLPLRKEEKEKDENG